MIRRETTLFIVVTAVGRRARSNNAERRADEMARAEDDAASFTDGLLVVRSAECEGGDQ